jgi:hypothetical protein
VEDVFLDHTAGPYSPFYTPRNPPS